MKKITAIVAGYGGRGAAYAQYATEHPELMQVVAVAEPHEGRRQTAKERHNLSDDRLFVTWEDLAAQPKMADFAIIGTQDNMHFGPAMALIEKGYHLLLEKPMAPTPEECKTIAEAAKAKGVHVVVCHVLRYTQFWRSIKSIIDSGKLGKIMSVIHMENVGHLHQSHSFVRGHWRNSKESNCMILAKSCHDMDLLQWLVGQKCEKVHSFGSLSHFCPENQPQGAPDRCTDGCPFAETCHYNAIKLYYDDKENLWFRGAATHSLGRPTDEEVMHALKNGPYGRCVYKCDNDVVDHQVVNLEFADGCTASFTMNAFNEGGRFIRIFGTEGELVSGKNQDQLEVFSFATKAWETVDISVHGNDVTSGHGGGDTGIMEAVLGLLRGETPCNSLGDVQTSYENHLIAFAAEKARVEGTVVTLDEFFDKE